MPVVLDDGRLRTLALGNEVVGGGGRQLDVPVLMTLSGSLLF